MPVCVCVGGGGGAGERQRRGRVENGGEKRMDMLLHEYTVMFCPI